VQRDLADGQHRNPEAHPGGFTTAYLHRRQELADELSEVGFDTEGPSEPSVIVPPATYSPSAGAPLHSRARV
jgi:hypothetical protein